MKSQWEVRVRVGVGVRVSKSRESIFDLDQFDLFFVQPRRASESDPRGIEPEPTGVPKTTVHRQCHLAVGVPPKRRAPVSECNVFPSDARRSDHPSAAEVVARSFSESPASRV